MWIGLTGSPRIGGILYDDQASVEGRAVPEHVVDERRGGLEVVVEERFRLVGEVVWRGVAEGRALALASDLALVFDFDLRTIAAGDPEWGTELSVTVRRTSDLLLTTPNDGVDAETGRPLAEHRAEWRSARTYTSAELGVVTGGYDVAAESVLSYTLGTYGDATAEPGPDYPILFTAPDGTTDIVAVQTVRLGPPALAAARVDDLGDTYRIHTRTPL